jgi:hypothetical protein
MSDYFYFSGSPELLEDVASFFKKQGLNAQHDNFLKASEPKPKPSSGYTPKSNMMIVCETAERMVLAYFDFLKSQKPEARFRFKNGDDTLQISKDDSTEKLSGFIKSAKKRSFEIDLKL